MGYRVPTTAFQEDSRISCRFTHSCDCTGQCWLAELAAHRRSNTLVGEWVQLQRVGQRVLVFYCRTLIRELDLQSQASVVLQRWCPQPEPDTAREDTRS